MKKFTFQVNVRLKNGITDPQGQAVRKVLSRSGYSIQDVRFSKLIKLEIEAESKDEATKKVSEIASKILANPVLEEYTVREDNG